MRDGFCFRNSRDSLGLMDVPQESRSIRLGWGEITTRKIQTARVREWFLCALDGTPETEQVRAELFAIWLAWRDRLPPADEVWAPKVNVPDHLTEWWAERWPLDAPLTAWAIRWHLRNAAAGIPEWIRATAARTLHWWSMLASIHGGVPRSDRHHAVACPEWSYPSAPWTAIPSPEERQRFDPYWTVKTLGRLKDAHGKGYAAHVDGMIEHELGAYAGADARYITPRVQRDSQYMRAFVLWQCVGLPYLKIANRLSVDARLNLSVDTIKRRVAELRPFLELDRLTTARRPRKRIAGQPTD